jgi:copper chaperone
MIKLNVSGMTCNHCVMAVTRALEGVSGVSKAHVSLERGEATVEGSPNVRDLIAAVEDEGYQAAESHA